jgi:tetrapyrrole methylase family protein/MazG family protein
MSSAFDQLVTVMSCLRGPGGCPWDRKQTPESLKPFLIEEAYEVLEAIDSPDKTVLCEELGDLLFQVLFHSEIAKEKGEFDIETVIKTSIDKMTRRHPHVAIPTPNGSAPIEPVERQETLRLKEEGISEASAGLTPEEVINRWEEIKRREGREKGNQKSVLDGVPKTLPALLCAHQVQAKAGRVGFDWKTPQAAFSKIEEEICEFKEEMDKGPSEALEAELGDLLFSIVNVARLLKVNPEEALRKTILRFMGRFKKMELAAGEAGLSPLSIDEMNGLWEEAKRANASSEREALRALPVEGATEAPVKRSMA